MEVIGASASILTFVTVAFSVTKSIHEALSAIQDGPQIIRFLTDEIAQLQSILQRLKQVSFVSIDDIDKVQLDGLAKKCKDDLAALDSQLKSLDVSAPDGRRGRLWRKLKLCFSEKDLDQIRHVVRGHVEHLTVRLNLIQVQQLSLTATRSTQILSALQQLIAERQTNNAATMTTGELLSPTSVRVTEVDVEEMDCSPDITLDESINRLMRLLEKKPCVVESDDSEELLEDLENLLEWIRKDAEPAESERTCQNCRQDISKELRLMTNIILSAPTMIINQSGAARLSGPKDEQLLISQERKQKTIETDVGVMTVTAARRRRKPARQIGNEQSKNESGRDFLAKLTYTSWSSKKMLILSVKQGQFWFNSFMNMLPCFTVCNILPRNSVVFDTARNGSVQELLQLIEGGKANIHDHDTYGWSLLHHSVGNLPVLKFLIEQGLDVDEVASRPDIEDQTTPLHLSLMHGVAPEHYEALLYAGADITLQVRGPATAIQWIANNDNEVSCLRMEQTLYISPFAYADSSDTRNQDLIPRVCVESYISLSSEPYQARRQIQYLLKKGYDINSFLQGKTGLHHLMAKNCLWLEYIPEYMDLLMFVIENDGDVWAVDDDGYLAAHYAYNITCEADYLFCPSAKGDLWDAALSYFGYDILRVRKYHPRKARYTSGYTRQDFEKLWQGREGDCPYWDDQPWPSSRQNTRYPFQQPGRSNLCRVCEICAMEPECFRCGVCLSSFEFFCEDDNHQHDRFCPREQVAVWELQKDDDEFYWELLPFSDSESDYDVTSSEDSDDGEIQLQDGLEEAFSNASVEEVL
ncbi:hypothetical protein FOVG_08016 [Fusarium oxysporum f. sp. pisi HDV247]|uniref:Azaphilone pigments biosynthesis cluster protein L N-terminal domain-containing protein n=1 Tax=Fusarium oxysporum f. sp. pisi HDV247 TaxID=1080344 RepID=W9PD18_FUSOX|nr:hypothetical protein FOVG_08016 [Fusarium oxysporum f. sp. pisi HDV247]